MMDESPNVSWISKSESQLFRLFPFSSIAVSSDFLKVDSHDRVLVSGGNGRGLVVRAYGSIDDIKDKAIDLVKKTGSSVLIGKKIGIDDGVVVWESIGKILVSKTNPLSPDAFSAWATEMANSILRVSREDLAAMGVDSLEHLEIDFRGMSPSELERALLGYRTTIATPTAKMLHVQRMDIQRLLRPILRQTTMAAQQIPAVRAGIGAGLSISDRNVSRMLAQHHAFWVRDRHGKISESLSRRAREIISHGVERGLGNREIGQELKILTSQGLQQRGYWHTVAMNHVARARSYALGNAYREAGIEYYKIEAVLDDKTTHQCEFLHQKVLPVGPAMQRIDQTLSDRNPESVLQNQPFIKDNKTSIDIDYPDGTSRMVAAIDTRSSGGTPSGVSSRFSNTMSASDMVSAAIGFPPYHFGCRTTTVPM